MLPRQVPEEICQGSWALLAQEASSQAAEHTSALICKTDLGLRAAAPSRGHGTLCLKVKHFRKHLLEIVYHWLKWKTNSAAKQKWKKEEEERAGDKRLVSTSPTTDGHNESYVQNNLTRSITEVFAQSYFMFRYVKYKTVKSTCLFFPPCHEKLIYWFYHDTAASVHLTFVAERSLDFVLISLMWPGTRDRTENTHASNALEEVPVWTFWVAELVRGTGRFNPRQFAVLTTVFSSASLWKSCNLVWPGCLSQGTDLFILS